MIGYSDPLSFRLYKRTVIKKRHAWQVFSIDLCNTATLKGGYLGFYLPGKATHTASATWLKEFTASS